ncbi:MAG: hypothetical protein ACNS62_22860 [Candidatus Cyclobacteriaceae bacterium M3_2C_046]
MEKETINLKSDKLFPFHIQLLGFIFFFYGLFTILMSPYLAPVFVFLGSMIITGYRGLVFDLNSGRFKEYNSFLFLKFGKWQRLDTAEKIFINAVNVSQKVYTMVTTGTTVRNIEYNSYLKLHDGQKIYLASAKHKKVLLKKLDPLARHFQLEITIN